MARDQAAMRKRGDILDDGAVIGDEAEQPDGEDSPVQNEPPGAPVDDAMVDELAETVDIRDLPPKTEHDPAPPAAPAPSAKPRISHRQRREQRQQQRLQTAEQQAEERAKKDPVVAPITRQENQTLIDYLQALTQGLPEVKITLYRQRPEMHQGVKCNGMLETFYRLVDEGDIRELHGGGQFRMVLHRRGPKGDWQILKHVTVEIAGDPKIESLKIRDEKPAAPAENKTESTVVGKVLDHLMDKRSQPAAPDMAMWRALSAPLEAQIASLSHLLEAKDRELAETRNRPADPMKDRFVEKLIDQDSARIAAINAQHESEIRTLKENARADLERERDRAEREHDRVTKQYERELATMKDAHHREITFMKETHAREIAGQKQQYENQLSTREQTGKTVELITAAENRRLEKENERLAKELETLRAKKEQTIKEKAEELSAVKELFEEDDDDEDKGVIGKLLDSPMAARVVEKVGGMFGQPQGGPPQQQMAPGQPPPGVPFRMADGRIGMLDPQGRLLIQQPKAVAAAGTPGAEGLGVDPAQMKDAMTFMEGAYKSGTDPKTFAATVRNVVPASVLGVLTARGVDEVLDKMAGLDTSSPLLQQGGRNWARKVAKALVGNED